MSASQKAEGRTAGASNRTANGLANLRPHWKPGQSGNPKGRAPALVDIASLARQHGPKCIEIAFDLATNSSDDRVRLAAVIALLDRGFGRPKQMIETTDGTSPSAMHYAAARLLSVGFLAELEQRATNGHAELQNGNAGNGKIIDLSMLPPPEE